LIPVTCATADNAAAHFDLGDLSTDQASHY
jgi:hypothetical protein